MCPFLYTPYRRWKCFIPVLIMFVVPHPRVPITLERATSFMRGTGTKDPER